MERPCADITEWGWSVILNKGSSREVNDIMKIAIIGCGFVGKAFKAALEVVHDIHVIDPALNTNKLSDHTFYDGILICVPTPANVDGSCDYSLLIDVMDSITDPTIPVMIKSTIDLKAWEHLSATYANPIVFSPEFLRQDFADRDLKANKYCILAGKNCNAWWTILVQSPTFKRKIYQYAFNEVREAIIMKYAVNSFLATKVIFFNQLKEFCDDNDIDFDRVRSLVSSDERIGLSHSNVTEQGGFGGACFPKDTKAFSHMDTNNRMGVLQKAIDDNAKYGGEDNEPSL